MNDPNKRSIIKANERMRSRSFVPPGNYHGGHNGRYAQEYLEYGRDGWVKYDRKSASRSPGVL